MSRIWSDVRQGVRALRAGRGITVLAVLAFALGIGITTAVFSLFYGVLLKPLPYPDPDQLVMVYDVQPACKTCPASFEKYTTWRTRNHVFQAMGGSFTPLVVVTGLGDPERVLTARATYTLPDVFEVQPAIGRWFNETEDQPGGAKVVVLSDGYWRQHFNGDSGALGRTMTIDGDPYEVIGVMPPMFNHRNARLFLPVARKFQIGQAGTHFLLTYARLKPGVTVAQAQREMVDLGRTIAPEFNTNHGIDVRSYYLAVIGDIAQPLQVLMGAVSLVLLIACANVANLLLASGLARRRELAVRFALGATRWDLARQLTLESITLALVGGVLGVFLAWWAVGVFVDLARTILPRASTISLDWRVVAFAATLSLLTGALCGLWPVVRLGGRTLAGDIREGDLRSGSQAGGRRFGNGLIVAEIALAFSLLVGAGLLIKSLLGLEAKETGFTTDRLVAFDVAPTGPRYNSDELNRAFYRDLLQRLSALSGVERVGVTSHLPMYQFGWNGEVTLEGGNPWKPNEAPLVEDRWIGGDYFKTMGIAIVQGRNFNADDRAGAPLVCIVSKRAAEKFWPGQNPIGRRLSKGGPSNPKLEVIGVAHDVLTFGLQRNSPYELYVPIEQSAFGAMTVVIRARAGDPTTVVPAARQVVAAIDPLLPVSRVQTMEAVVGTSVGQPRLLSSLSSLFGALAGILAIVGVYGVMAYNVRRERREFGIRLALGADPAAVRRLVVRRGFFLGIAGVAAGGLAALLLTRTMQSLLSGVKPTDPLVFTLTGATLLIVTLLAGYLPALQASRTDPMVALRAE